VRGAAGRFFVLAFTSYQAALVFMWNERRLPRLAPEFYQGYAHVLWTHVVEGRQTGWLNERWYAQFRECLLHTCVRYRLGCARYVVMPDHLHLIWVGADASSDQLKATKFFRRYSAARWQKQAHDHVLREAERERGAFANVCDYLGQNPVRAGLVASANDWPYAGSLVPGFPELDALDASAYWRCYTAYRASFSGQ
jgi:REP element-mobilizing transposase RayT